MIRIAISLRDLRRHRPDPVGPIDWSHVLMVEDEPYLILHSPSLLHTTRFIARVHRHDLASAMRPTRVLAYHSGHWVPYPTAHLAS